ncbi:TetR-like C-terminal domain-containing protein [Steroidobacter denitrificans]|nr:TetR-like C-terminal domain-containing protein [Steroidobacter denitrificans]
MQEVVTLSGIGRSTLFRRWPDRDALIVEALSEHVSQLQIVTSRDWERDLATNMHGLCRFVARPIELALNKLLVTTHNAALKKAIIDAWLPILRVFEQPLRHALRSGELIDGTDTRQVVRFIFAEMAFRSMIDPASMDEKYVDGLLRLILQGIKQERHSSAR